MRKPTHLFRAMTAEEVEVLWTRLYNASKEAETRSERCVTDDGQGLRFLFQRDYDNWRLTHSAFEQARHMFVEILAEKK
jgi:hypothetical protein